MTEGKGLAALRGAEPGDGLLHPAILVSLGLLLLNDHVLKTAMPGALTGKLSDVAGLAFFPMLLIAGWELLRALGGRSAQPSLAAALAAAGLTGVAFSLAKATPAGAASLGWTIGALQWLGTAPARLLAGHVPPLLGARVVMDPTDLLALPALAIPVLVMRWRARAATRAAAPTTLPETLA
jgi:hypothetical protein